MAELLAAGLLVAGLLVAELQVAELLAAGLLHITELEMADEKRMPTPGGFHTSVTETLPMKWRLESGPFILSPSRFVTM